MHKLGRKAKAILAEVFFQGSMAPAGVEAAWFRAKRESELDLMDELERDGFLRREEGRYLVSLTALPHIRHPLSKEAFSAFEKIFSALKDNYREHLSTPVHIDELAKKIGLNEQRVRVWLNYMIEGSWWGGRTTDLLGSEDAAITPSEAVLKIRKFRDVIKQLQDWQEKRLDDRQNTVPISQLRQSLARVGPDRINVDETLVGRPKPDWYEQLPETVRELLDEVYSGMIHGLRSLPAMGARAAIDRTLTDLSPEYTRFSERLSDVVARGFVSQRDADAVDAAIESGHAATHRAHFLSRSELDALLDVTEHFLRGVYILPEKARTLREKTPKRSRRIPRTPY